MCGRYVLKANQAQLAERFQAAQAEADLHLEPRYNIAPSQANPVIVATSPNRIELMQWGLVPSWSKEPSTRYSTINARVETVASKPAYRRLLGRHRCLVPATGFYEWQKLPGPAKKAATQPYLMQISQNGEAGALFAFAGLYDIWHGQDGQVLQSYTILTTDANELLRPIHERMPVILPRESEMAWLDSSLTDPARLLTLLHPYPPDQMLAYPVSPAVNSPSHDGPELIESMAGGV